MEADEAEKFFPKNFSPRDRAIFEAGIALGAIYHQLVGFPASKDERLIKLLEEAFSRAFQLQPFRSKVEIEILREKLKGGQVSPYQRYEDLKGEHLKVRVEVSYRGVKVKACLRYVEELGYPLMYVEEVSEG
ncbi:hypothetical protein DRO53_00995 [Candidatus Bathyarchaeota archaeon]|nr:MAG: hypothetical protein DRO53_00995 [Candidatus Bathyarchaeota archaeon]